MSKRHFSPVVLGMALCGLTTIPTRADDASSKLATMPVKSAYSDHIFRWSDVKPDDLGQKPLVYDSAGIRPVSPAPPPGVHPRVFFGPDELPGLRRRLQQTPSGRRAWQNLLAYSTKLRASADYKRLIAGDTSADPRAVDGYCVEAFRCLMEDDHEHARQLAQALMTLRAIDQAAQASAKKPDPHPFEAGFQASMAYDLLFNDMTPEQRSVIRAWVAQGQDYHAYYGTFTAPEIGISNWAALTSGMVVDTLAIEGEPGYNPYRYQGEVRALKNFLNYGWYASGFPFEGLGKNYQFDDVLVALLKRGEKMAELPSVRAYGENYLFQSMQPYRGSFFGYDLWGGTDRGAGFNSMPTPVPSTAARPIWLPMCHDVIALKYLFPDSKKIDWVYRNYVRDDYSRLPTSPSFASSELLTALIFATDYDPANTDPARISNSMTCFSPEGGFLVTRSDWTTDGLLLAMHTREDIGGHTNADRNSFNLTGAGRVWGRIDSHNSTSFQNSLVIVDGQEQPSQVPAKVVAFVDRPLATFMAGDAKHAWDWNWSAAKKDKGGQVALPAGWEKETLTPNDTQFVKSPLAFMNVSYFDRPHVRDEANKEWMIRQPNYPVMRAFRTAGVVRGPHPFALIVDDIQHNTAVSHYDWLMQIPNDVSIARIAGDDIFLSGGNTPRETQAARPPQPGEPMLLVRLLQCDGVGAGYGKEADGDTPKSPGMVAYISHSLFFRSTRKTEKPTAANTGDVKTLIIPADAVAPNYKVFLFPYHQGEELPTTGWDADHAVVTIRWKDETQRLRFTANADGRTRITVNNGADVTQLP